MPSSQVGASPTVYSYSLPASDSTTWSASPTGPWRSPSRPVTSDDSVPLLAVILTLFLGGLRRCLFVVGVHHIRAEPLEVGDRFPGTFFVTESCPFY